MAEQRQDALPADLAVAYERGYYDARDRYAPGAAERAAMRQLLSTGQQHGLSAEACATLDAYLRRLNGGE